MTYGVTPTGFVPKTLDVILSEIEADERGAIDPALDVSPEQPLGQINGIFSKKIAECWELLDTAYGAIDPNKAEDFLLDNACALTGTKRRPRTKSYVIATMNLNAGVTVAAGAVANVAGQTSNRWILAGPADSFGRLTTRGAGVTNSGGSPANVKGYFESEQYGAFVANAGTLTAITAPISGWNTVTNAADAIPGGDVEKDPPLRLRRKAELSAVGSGTVDAMRGDLLEVAGVQQVTVLENNTLASDANGLPPKSIEAVIFDGDSPAALDTDLAATIWKDKPSGAATVGGSTVTTPDGTGALQSVQFTRATSEQFYYSLTVKTDPLKFPSDGVTQIKNALIAATAGVPMGGLVTYGMMASIAFDIAGVRDVTAFTMGLAPTPVGVVSIQVPIRQVPRSITTNIVVTVI